jgi:hypothetical protein
LFKGRNIQEFLVGDTSTLHRSPVVQSLNDGENVKFFRYFDIASEVAEKKKV